MRFWRKKQAREPGPELVAPTGTLGRKVSSEEYSALLVPKVEERSPVFDRIREEISRLAVGETLAFKLRLENLDFVTIGLLRTYCQVEAMALPGTFNVLDKGNEVFVHREK